MDVRSHRYAQVNSDHFLIVSRIQARICNAKKFSGKKVEEYDHEKMTLLEKQVEHKINLIEYLQELVINPDDSLHSRWNNIICTINKTAEEVFGKKAESSQMTGFQKNAKRLQKSRIKHMLTCNSEVIQELQLMSIEKQDEKKNKYVRGRRKSKKLIRF